MGVDCQQEIFQEEWVLEVTLELGVDGHDLVSQGAMVSREESWGASMGGKWKCHREESCHEARNMVAG